MAGQGDSIHAALNRELQEKLAPALFNDSFRQAEKMFGKSISKGEWKTDSAQGITIYYSDVEFERYISAFWWLLMLTGAEHNPIGTCACCQHCPTGSL